METGAVGKSSEVGQDPLSELNEDGPDDLGVDPAEYERMRYSLELEVARWREEGRDSSNAQQLWRHYCELTRDLSYELCEQLRSILEPTLATKLKGDYRTGKRLNMRKVIPYIASKFKKDKIWLRRTKPSKRTYQILVSVDDSKSMSQTHSIQLAFESLSLLAKALTQLEVGELAVTSFGDTVNLLHPFEMPFTDETGGELLQKFTFLQESTRVGTMMESTLNILRSARENISGGGPSDLWQLHIIVSDGICEDHEAVRKLVRLATTELQVMVVFIVLDRREERDSIMKMSNVTYGTDRSSGKPTLQMTRYMDTFPFDNYVVLRDINGLPEVLSETLRQYFAFVSEP
ncbi:hypothetical protein BJ742DRAFT_681204 [Cladochytrium replicatum]|nr:hypothetical protein BJ742DRAFT_681204 [Cladochytrium replicatum]